MGYKYTTLGLLKTKTISNHLTRYLAPAFKRDANPTPFRILRVVIS